VRATARRGLYQDLRREGDGRAQRPTRASQDARPPRRRGDVVTVTHIDRLARSTFDLFAIVKQIVDAKAQFRSLAEPWADTGTSTGRLMIAVLGGLADVERHLIRSRTVEGTSRAKAQGQPMGRRSRRRPPHAARRALRWMNSPAATTWEYPPFAARRERHEQPSHA
jgi:DNA invertase Pin-like site-specific DNA recombinase